MKRVSRSDRARCGPASRNTEVTKLRAAVSAMAVFLVDGGLHGGVRRSMCTWMKSWPERAVGSLIKSRPMHPEPPSTARRHWQREEEAGLWETVGFDALAGLACPDVLLHSCGQAWPPMDWRASASVLSRPKCPPKGVE